MANEVITVEKNIEKKPVAIDASLIEDLCHLVANGGSVVKFCRIHQLNYSYFMSALRLNKAYEAMYVQACIDREEWFKDTLLEEMKDMLEANISDVFNGNNEIKPLRDIPRDITKNIKSFKKSVNTEGYDSYAIEMYDRQKSIDQLGRHYDMFIEKKQIDVRMSLEDTIVKSNEIKK